MKIVRVCACLCVFLALRVLQVLVCELGCNNANVISLCKISYMLLTLKGRRSELTL